MSKGLASFTQLFKVRGGNSSMALNINRKLDPDPYLAIHGKIMAKNGHFFMELGPIFDIFHRLRPHLCTKGEDLGFHKQATHRRRGDEPFFYPGVDRS